MKSKRAVSGELAMASRVMGTERESLPTEDTSTRDPEEAQLWIRAYGRLSSQADAIVREGSPSDTVTRAANRYQQRLQFWSTRYRHLTGY